MPVEVANTISSVGIFFAGLGLLLLSFGLFWFVDVYKKRNNQNKPNRLHSYDWTEVVRGSGGYLAYSV